VFGKGSYFDPSKKTFLESLPLIGAVNPKVAFKKTHDGKDKLVLSPADEKEAVYDYTFDKDCAGATEYGYGLWSRWLTTTPTRVL